MTDSKRTLPLGSSAAAARRSEAPTDGDPGRPPEDDAPEIDAATTLPTRSAVGVVVDGRFQIVAPLAAGGMGSVYLGEQHNLRRKVAIKLVKQPDPDDALRFRREAEALGEISHPAVVEVHDYIEDSEAEISYLVMAYVNGENVSDFLDSLEDECLPPLEALELLQPVASALVELHAHGILHRDIKPANLVRYERADGRAAVKLVDFGIARREQDPGITADGLVVGTPPYLSPEVILGGKHSEASDVFAFGATFYEVLTGEPPHGSDDLQSILTRAVKEDVRLPPALMGTGLGKLLLTILARDEEERPSMQVVLDEMDRLRLALLMEHGETAAALEATRQISTASIAAGLRAVRNRDLPTVPTRTPAPGTEAPAPEPELTPPRGRALPWIVSALSVAAAVAVTLFFVLRPPPASKTPAAPAAPAATSGEDAGEPARVAPRPRPRTGARTAHPGRRAPARRAAPADARVAKLLAQCTDLNQAYGLFKRATYLYKQKRNRDWALAVFTALIDCTYTQLRPKRWAAYRLARLHIAAGDCGAAKRAWARFTTFDRKLGHPRQPMPRCTPKPRP